MCRYKNGRRLARGKTRESRKKNDPFSGTKRSPSFSSEAAATKNHTKERRAERAFNKMSEEARERIRKERKKRARRRNLMALSAAIVFGGVRP
ncbi:MAG: hypothetical protein HYT93_01650 [Parcubacteria group bacterium]|nr:hypothetical protein [Parcubacteria group bacterium]